MPKVEDILWGHYQLHEGPWYPGTCKYVLPANPTQEDRILAVVTAVESGTYDAVNMYDDGILSSGLIQWIEAGQFSVSGMLGAVHDARGSFGLRALTPALKFAKAEFLKDIAGKHRFYIGSPDRPAEKVDTTIEQRMLFTGGSDEEGTWTEENKLLAKTWAACVAEVWKDPENQAIQREFTADRLSQFVRPSAHQVFTNMSFSCAPKNIMEAAYAAYLSFAVNNPVRAERHLLILEEGRYFEEYNEAWLNALLKELTYGPGIAIYPARYHAIKPLLEKFYGVKLFDGVGEVSEWIEKNPGLRFLNVEEAQHVLLKLGYDLGPWKADGKFGRKTKDALYAFQCTQGLLEKDCDGTLNAATCEALRKLA